MTLDPEAVWRRLERRRQYRRDVVWLDFYRATGVIPVLEWLEPRTAPLLGAMDRFGARHPRWVRVWRVLEWVGLFPWRLMGLSHEPRRP